VTSVTIIILVAAYILHDRLRIRYEKLDDNEKINKLDRLNQVSRMTLGLLAFFGGLAWILFMKTHTIYISPELEGFHNLIPAIVMSAVGVLLVGGGIRKYFSTGNSTEKTQRRSA
jgi:hypothetical protein